MPKGQAKTKNTLHIPKPNKKTTTNQKIKLELSKCTPFCLLTTTSTRAVNCNLQTLQVQDCQKSTGCFRNREILAGSAAVTSAALQKLVSEMGGSWS